MTRLNRLEKRVRYYKLGLESMLSTTYSFESIIGESRSLLEAKGLAEKYARTESPILIIGSTGTGKELFAHAVHSASRRKNRPFVCVNCAAIPRDLLESELFGYETGAFTGAHRKGKAGKIELAHRGTLFLDEIGDIPMSSQAKLLRVIETGRIEKIGSLKPVKVDFRLVAATNRNLKNMMKSREFREDLFYRLNTMILEVPPLKERTDDIPSLIRHFLKAIGKSKVEVTEGTLGILKNYSWPGNVRELKNVVERAGSLLEGDLLDLAQLPSEIRSLGINRRQRSELSGESLFEQMASHEREIIRHAIKAMNGNMSRTARLLRISRSTLYEKCKSLGL
jgi:transcriptional regulator with PAS, ATPase and Fis domain